MRCGVYEILNVVTGKRYVGSAKNFDARWHAHRVMLKRGRHHSSHLQASWRKYGADAFECRPLLICAPRDLLMYEQAAFDALRPEYNIAPTAGSSLGRSHSSDTRAKISARAKGRKYPPDVVERRAAKRRGVPLPPERIAHMIGNKHALGSKHTDEWKAQNSARNLGKPRPKSPEYRAKIAAALRGIPHSPERRAAQAEGQRGKKRGPYKLDPAKAEMRRAAGLQLAESARQARRRRMNASLIGMEGTHAVAI